MLRIFLTGDNHIGLKYANHREAEKIRKRRIEAFDGMVRAANEEGCDLFVVAGDLFENTGGIAKRDMEPLVETLSRFHGTAAVLPGNHDYYDGETKVWQSFEGLIQSRDNVMLLSENRTYSLTCGEEDVILYPAPCRSLHSEPGENNLGWIKKETIVPDHVYRIGIAHGAVEGETIDKEGAYFRMTRRELEAIPVDVWLLGHTHVPFPGGLREDVYTPAGRIFNAGTHVQTDVSCSTDGECFLIEIDADKTVKAKKFVSGNLHFCRRQLAFTGGRFADGLREGFQDLDDGSVVDAILTGSVSAEEYEKRNDILERELGRFLEWNCDDSALSRQVTEEQIDAEFPETSFSAGLLKALLDEPKEAQLVYELVRSLEEAK